jgi:hypothetical protein
MSEPLLIDPGTLAIYLALSGNAEVRALLLELGIVPPDDADIDADGESDA